MSSGRTGKVLAFVLVTALAMAGWTATASAQSAEPADDKLIVPGERIGGLRLSGRLADLEAVYGRGTPEGPGLSPGSTYYSWSASAIAAIADQTNGALLWISVCACHANPFAGHATAEGVGLGATEERVIAAMGPPTRTYSDAEGKSLYYAGRGLAFTFASQGPTVGVVESLRIFWPYRSPADATVVPGTRISILTVGMPVSQAEAILGPGFSRGRVGSAEGRFWPCYGLIAYSRDDRVFEVSAVWGQHLEDVGVRYATADGVGIGSSADDVRRAYGQPAQRRMSGRNEIWVYPDRGLFFVISSDVRPSTVMALNVFARR